jgi:Protein of unknown function (DUF1326)
MAPLGRLFRELQLQRRLSVSRIEGGAPDLAADRGRLRCRGGLPYREGQLWRRGARRAQRGAGDSHPWADGDGNWAVGAYIDQRADEKQTEALGSIFTGAAGGPMAAFAPLIAKNLGMRKVPITYRVQGKKRSAEIPGILHMAVDPLPTMHPSGEIWANVGHPISPDKLAFAVGAAGSTFSDHGMRWDNSGKNGHYAPIRWSNH